MAIDDILHVLQQIESEVSDAYGNAEEAAAAASDARDYASSAEDYAGSAYRDLEQIDIESLRDMVSAIEQEAPIAEPWIVVSGDLITGFAMSGPYERDHAEALAATNALKHAVKLSDPQPRPNPSDTTEAVTTTGEAITVNGA